MILYLTAKLIPRRNRSKEQLRATAKVPEVLIPIRLDYEHEAYKLRDTFTWNLRGA